MIALLLRSASQARYLLLAAFVLLFGFQLIIVGQAAGDRAHSVVQPRRGSAARFSAARPREQGHAPGHVQGHRLVRLLPPCRRDAPGDRRHLSADRAGARSRVRPGRSRARPFRAAPPAGDALAAAGRPLGFRGDRAHVPRDVPGRRIFDAGGSICRRWRSVSACWCTWPAWPRASAGSHCSSRRCSDRWMTAFTTAVLTTSSCTWSTSSPSAGGRCAPSCGSRRFTTTRRSRSSPATRRAAVNLVVLFSAAAVFIALSYWQFQRRDL